MTSSRRVKSSVTTVRHQREEAILHAVRLCILFFSLRILFFSLRILCACLAQVVATPTNIVGADYVMCSDIFRFKLNVIEISNNG